MPTASKTDRLHDRAAGRPLLEAMGSLLRGALAGRHTLLAVCPNSDAVVRAALQAARDADAPLLFAATLNQVDFDGGYTGWTPQTLAAFVDREARALGLDVPVLLCLDHGGPWKKDRPFLEEWPFDAAMEAARRAIAAGLAAGYALLHVDVTVDRRLPPDTPVPVDALVERTVALMQHAEAVRARQGRPPVSYEVGVEEVGGPDNEARFAAFLERLVALLDRHGLPRPCFAVGDVGTTVDTAGFDAAQARRLVATARRHGALVKAHYTDGVADLAAYPACGIGGANVGPGFAAEEAAALAELEALERRHGRDAGFGSALHLAVEASGVWRKWLHPDEADRPFSTLTPERRGWLVETGSRYVWTTPDVRAARRRLYANVAPFCDADAFVVERLRTAVFRHFEAFRLVGFNDRLLEALPGIA